MSGNMGGGTNRHPENSEGRGGNSRWRCRRIDPAAGETCVPDPKAVDPESATAGFNAAEYYGELGWEAEFCQTNPDPERLQQRREITPEQVAQWLARADAHRAMLKKMDGVYRALFDEFCGDVWRIARLRWCALRWKFYRFRFRSRIGLNRIGSVIARRTRTG